MLSIIVPVYNEEKKIVENALNIYNTLSCYKFDFELIFSDDGSSDDTYARLRDLAEKIPIKICVNQFNEGKGTALCIAYYFEVEGDYVTFFDGDCDISPHAIYYSYMYALNRDSDIMIGSKLHNDSSMKYRWYRRLTTNCYYWLTWLLFDLPCKDTQTGIKVFKAGVLGDTIGVTLTKRFAFDLEVLVAANRRGYKIVEFPVSVRIRRNRIKFRSVFKMIVDTLAIWYRLNIVKQYDLFNNNNL